MSQDLIQRECGVKPIASTMNSFERFIFKADICLKRLSTWSIVAFVAAMVICIWISVFTRYVMGDSINWGEQVAKYLMIWAAMVGSSLAVREGAHISVNILVDRLPVVLAKTCMVVGFMLSGTFLAVAAYYGTIWALGAMNQVDSVVGNMPLTVPYLAIPVGSMLMLVQLFLTLVKHLEHDGSDY